MGRRQKQKWRKGHRCVQLRPLAFSLLEPGLWWVLSCRKRRRWRRGEGRGNRITPPLTQGSCLSEMLSIRAHVSIRPTCHSLATATGKHAPPFSCICPSSDQPQWERQICWRGHIQQSKIIFIIGVRHYQWRSSRVGIVTESRTFLLIFAACLQCRCVHGGLTCT